MSTKSCILKKNKTMLINGDIESVECECQKRYFPYVFKDKQTSCLISALATALFVCNGQLQIFLSAALSTKPEANARLRYRFVKTGPLGAHLTQFSAFSDGITVFT